MKRKRGSSSVTEKSADVVKVQDAMVIKKMDTVDPFNVHVSPEALGIGDIDKKTGQVKTEIVELDSPESKKQEVEEEKESKGVKEEVYELPKNLETFQEKIKKLNKRIQYLEERQGEWVHFSNMMQRMFPDMIPPSRRQNQPTNDNPNLL